MDWDRNQNSGCQGRGELEQPNGSRGIKTDLESFLKRCGDIRWGHAGISPGFKQSKGQILC